MTTPAAEMRAAARKMRTYDGPAAVPIAEWLEICADYAERWAPEDQLNSTFRRGGHKVARAILGQQPRETGPEHGTSRSAKVEHDAPTFKEAHRSVEPQTTPDRAQPDFTSPIAGRIEVRHPCAHCNQIITGAAIREWTGPASNPARQWHADRPECAAVAFPDAPGAATELGTPPTSPKQTGDSLGDNTPDGLRAQYADAMRDTVTLSDQTPTDEEQHVLDDLTDTVLAVRDRELQQLRADCQQLSDQADEWCERATQAEELQRIAHDTSNKSEQQRAQLAALAAVILARFTPAWPSPDEPMRYRATVTNDDYQQWHTALDQDAEQPAEPTAAWTPPPPGDTREQLPDHLLALIRPYLRGYTSTACATAGYLAEAIADRPEHRAELIEWRRRMRKRCRSNQKYTGETCPHHTPKEQP